MTYQEALIQKGRFEDAHFIAAKKLDAVVGDARGPMGLTPDHIRAKPEWVAAFRAERAAYEALRKFNTAFSRAFAKEIRAEDKATRMARIRETRIRQEAMVALNDAGGAAGAGQDVFGYDDHDFHEDAQND